MLTHARRRPHAATGLALALALGVFAAADAEQNQENDTRALEGRRFRCCTLVEDPHVYEDITATHRGYSGLAVKYLDHLEKLGFSCGKLKLYANLPPAREFPGFNGFVDYMRQCSSNGNTSNCMCDFGVGGWVTIPQRFGKVDFISPYTNDNFVVVTTVSNVRVEDNNQLFFYTPFKIGTWLAILSIIFLHVLLNVFDKKFAPCPPSDAPPKHLSFPRRMWHMMTMTRLSKRVGHATYSTWMAFLGHNAIDADASVHLKKSDEKGKMQSARHRFRVIFALLCSLYLVLLYESALVTDVLNLDTVSSFQSIDDFKECRIPTKDMCVPGSGAVEEFWNETIVSARAACEESTDPAKRTSSYAGGFEATGNGTCKYFAVGQSTAIRAVNRRYCGNLTVAGKTFAHQSLSYVFARGSPLTETFSNATLILRQQGKLVEVSEYLSKRSCEVGRVTQLSFPKLQSFFFIAYGVVLLMFIITIFDCSQDDDAEKGVSEDGPTSQAFEKVHKVEERSNA